MHILRETLTTANALPITWIAALMVGIGLLGIVVPVIPGLLLSWAGVLVWALYVRGPIGWTALGVATVIMVIGSAVKYLLPGRQMRSAGVPWRTLAVGSLAGIVGFFVIPVLGFFLGFILGVYVAELLRLTDRSQAWPSTVAALKGVGVSMLIELISGVLIAATLAAAVIAS